MLNRKLLAALVGLSLAAGTFGAASAQTTTAPATVQSAPVASPATAPSVKPATTKKHTRMHKPMHRKHVAHRATAGTKLAKASTKQVAAKASSKRIRVSHAAKRTTRHV